MRFSKQDCKKIGNIIIAHGIAPTRSDHKAIPNASEKLGRAMLMAGYDGEPDDSTAILRAYRRLMRRKAPMDTYCPRVYDGQEYTLRDAALAARRRDYVAILETGAFNFTEAARIIGVSKRTGKVWRNGRTHTGKRTEPPCSEWTHRYD